VCYAYDPVFLGHDLPTHPENAGRLRAVMAALGERGVLDRLVLLPVEPAPMRWITRIHDPAYLTWLHEASRPPVRRIDQDNYIGPGSYLAAVSAVGAAVECVRAVLDGRAQRALALVRPPGHHALPEQAMGFCLLNSAACAAAYALEEAGLERVLILDYDVHHGNGTQQAFWHDPRVLYVSLHQRPLFPGSGSAAERGEGPGLGYTVNLPLPPGAGDGSFSYLLAEVIEPLVGSYRPQLVLLSAGYDAHWRDPLANLRATLPGLDHLVQRALALADQHCQGRLVAVLEGGYDLEVLGAGVANLAEVLLGTPERCQDPVGASPLPAADELEHLEALKRGFLG
jgi:acetoin utilization deacetylase AcuC-like enzyme